MGIIDDVADYEAWLRTQCAVVEGGLKTKHKRMAKNSLMFFRATCFRFARQLASIVPDLAEAPAVISVGDAHIENFGTWRDGEGRLVWGVNDFDEAARLPYTFDLIRLATSARLADTLPISAGDCAKAILKGYGAGLRNPAPCFVTEDAPWMVRLVAKASMKALPLSHDLEDLKPTTPPEEVKRLLLARLPEGASVELFGAWQKGGGSLGRPRFVAAGTWTCGPAVREAKALVPSAWEWASGAGTGETLFKQLAEGRYRSPDPFLDVAEGYVVRRLANDSFKIDLSHTTARAYGASLFRAMGADLAAVHLGESGQGTDIRAHLDAQREDWLHRAAQRVASYVERDFADWVEAY
ncbi:DUF2252 family protein [Aquabacter cavernae]|uniref:DUF2252 family protein n=1 Tax=Aquabacter cavernae TaxID=2496029 RepID=UPI000F8CD81C|nr:DUF2252 family protein [Aquabacter cavernae]